MTFNIFQLIHRNNETSGLFNHAWRATIKVIEIDVIATDADKAVAIWRHYYVTWASIQEWVTFDRRELILLKKHWDNVITCDVITHDLFSVSECDVTIRRKWDDDFGVFWKLDSNLWKLMDKRNLFRRLQDLKDKKI